MKVTQGGGNERVLGVDIAEYAEALNHGLGSFGCQQAVEAHGAKGYRTQRVVVDGPDALLGCHDCVYSQRWPRLRVAGGKPTLDVGCGVRGVFCGGAGGAAQHAVRSSARQRRASAARFGIGFGRRVSKTGAKARAVRGA